VHIGCERTPSGSIRYVAAYVSHDHRLEPLDRLNAASPLAALSASAMPTSLFYTRSNFEVPTIDPATWSLEIGGLVGNRSRLSMDDIQAFGAHGELVTLECAGNGRLLMDPVPNGAPWGLGAVSVAEFTGTPLAGVLGEARPDSSVVEYVFTGLDRGRILPEEEIHYAFSLTAEEAMSHGPLLVWAMNGEPLTPEHGAPLRLIVPGSYGMKSVKWLGSIEAIDRPFDGHFRNKYRYYGGPRFAEEAPVDAALVRALITSPADGAKVKGEIEVSGVAWSGSGSIESVEIRVDEGPWLQARRGVALGQFAPAPWSARVECETGRHRIACRATDASGGIQPTESIWNRNGYGNNVVHTVEVTVG
jgi:DMSO/TMAO reductase YedYZ molybdopterin-dependent catalytic subunit